MFIVSFKQRLKSLRYGMYSYRRDCVANLTSHFGCVTHKNKIVWERLNSCALTVG